MRGTWTLFYRNRLGLQVGLFAALAALFVTSITLAIVLVQFNIDWLGNRTLLFGLATALLAQSVAIGLTMMVLHDRFISRSIKIVTRAVTAVAGGNLEAAVPVIRRGDQLGDIAAALEVFKSNQIHAQKLGLENELLKTRLARDSRVIMHTLEQDFDDSFSALAGILHKTSAPEKEDRTLSSIDKAEPALAALAEVAASVRRDIAKELNLKTADETPEQKKA